MRKRPEHVASHAGQFHALGWGVDEDKVVSSLLQRSSMPPASPLRCSTPASAYNAERYSSASSSAGAVRPTDLLILAFVRDGEELSQGGGNILLRNSQLAVTAWTAINRVFTKSGEATLVDHYRQVYAPGSPALAQMKAEFAKLGAYAREHDIRVTMAMVPDIHSLTDYPFRFVHEIFAQAADDNGFAYIDFLPASQVRAPEDI